MRKVLTVSLVALALGLTGAKLLITEYQAVVSGSLEQLKFQFEPPPRGIVGAPPVFKATPATLKYLQGKTFEIQGDGTIKEVRRR